MRFAGNLNPDLPKLYSCHMGIEEGLDHVSTSRGITSGRALSALLSQVLVAFTVELDNEPKRRMGEADSPGARLSLVACANLMRFVAEGAMSVRNLAARASSCLKSSNSAAADSWMSHRKIKVRS